MNKKSTDYDTIGNRFLVECENIYFKNRTPTEAVISIKELFADNLHLCRQFEMAAGNKIVSDPFKSFNVIMNEENDKREILRRIRNSVSTRSY